MDPKSAMGSDSGSSKLKNTATWNNNKISNNEKVIKSGVKWDYPYGYGCSWPTRHYTCSFCKREFNSAQALGGHMNVHRRDRAARFIHHSPSPPASSTSLSWLHAYEIPNPNPSGLTPLSSSSSSPSPSAAKASIYTHQYSLVSLSHSSLSSSTLPYTGGEDRSVDLGERFNGTSSSNFKGGFSSKDEEDQAVKLDLELGLIRDTKVDDGDHDLDLELRLGNKKP